MRRSYGLPWTLHCPMGRYCDVTLLWPVLFHGIRADLSGTPINPWQREFTAITGALAID